MVDQHENVEDISTINRFSPYLFLSLFLLTYNISLTLIGAILDVMENKGDLLADEVVQKMEAVYGVSLALFLLLCIIILILKYGFIMYKAKITCHQCCKLAVTVVFDPSQIELLSLRL